MAYIAELGIKIDTADIDRAKKKLEEFIKAASSAPPISNAEASSKSVQQTINAIDREQKALDGLARKRKALAQITTSGAIDASTSAKLGAELDAQERKIRLRGTLIDEQNRRQMAAIQLRANAENAAHDKRIKSIAANDELSQRIAQREQRDLDRTISGLSRQIKAQEDYNRTVEKLNRGLAKGSISTAEYDTYTKIAAAKRDDALASKDMSRELERSKSKIDSVTASLGLAEKAQVQYSRNVRTLLEGLRLGTITIDQYNEKLGQLNAKRQASISAANGTAAAETQFSRNLQATLAAYDPVMRAQQQYNTGVQILAEGLQRGKLSVEQFNKALTDHRTVLDQVKASQPTPEKSQATLYQSAIDRLVPYNAQLRNLADAERALQQAQSAGLVTTQQEIKIHKEATAAIAAERKEIERRQAAGAKAGNSAKQDAAAMRGLPAQFTDIVVSLQGGQAPLTVLLQQGGQIKDMFGGIGPALKAMGQGLLTTFKSLLTPMYGVAAAIGVVSAALYTGSQEAVDFNRAITLGGNAAGVSLLQFGEFRTTLDGIVGTAGKAAEALTLMAASGNITSGNFVGIATAAIKMQKATGMALKDIIADFASLGKDPVNAAISLDEKYKFLNSTILATADSLVRQGREQEATIMLQQKMEEAANKTADVLISKAGLVEWAWRGIKEAVTETWDAIKNIGREDPISERIAELQKNISKRKELGWDYEPYERQLAALQKLKLQDDENAATARKNEEARKLGIKITKDNISAYESNIATIDRVNAAEVALAKVKKRGQQLAAAAALDNRKLTKEELLYQDAAIKAAEQKIKDAKEAEAKKDKPKKTVENEAARTLTSLREQEASLQQQLVSANALNSANRTLTTDQKNLAELKYRIADAEEKMAKGVATNGQKSLVAQKSILLVQAEKNAKLSEEIRLTKQAAEEKVKLAALEKSLAEENAQIQMNVDQQSSYAGRGSVAKQRLEEEFRIRQDYAKRIAQSEQMLAAGEIDQGQYEKRVQAFRTAEAQRLQIQMNANAQLDADNASWTNGIKSSWEDLQTDAADVSGNMASVFSQGFNSMTDAMASFVTTGKTSFADWGRSILGVLAKVLIQMAVVRAIGAAMSMWAGGAAGGLGSASTSGASAGATSVGSGISPNVGPTISFPQAQGGAWSGGVQMYAKGGSFTNSVVSKPTAFAASNGLGVMGEAGPEAILPLTRTSSGALGVSAVVNTSGVQGAAGSGVQVNIVINGDQQAESTSSDSAYENFGQTIGQIVQQEYRRLITKDLSPGGQVWQQMTPRVG